MCVLSHSSTDSAFKLMSCIFSQILTQVFLLTYCNKSKYPPSCFEGLIYYKTRYFYCYKNVCWFLCCLLLRLVLLLCLVLRCVIIIQVICVWSCVFCLFLCCHQCWLFIFCAIYDTNPHVWRYLGCLTYFCKLFLSYLISYGKSQ